MPSQKLKRTLHNKKKETILDSQKSVHGIQEISTSGYPKDIIREYLMEKYSHIQEKLWN